MKHTWKDTFMMTQLTELHFKSWKELCSHMAESPLLPPTFLILSYWLFALMITLLRLCKPFLLFIHCITQFHGACLYFTEFYTLYFFFNFQSHYFLNLYIITKWHIWKLICHGNFSWKPWNDSECLPRSTLMLTAYSPSSFVTAHRQWPFLCTLSGRKRSHWPHKRVLQMD